MVIALALLTAYLAPVTNPGSFIFPAFFGLFYPIVLIANLLFVIYWISLKNWRFILSTIIIPIGWTHLTGFFQINIPSGRQVSANEVKILSYNVRLFDLYNWTKNVETRDKIFDFLKNEDADIICFQEFYYNKKPFFITLDTLQSLQKASNMHTANTFTDNLNQFFGIATFSKFPIINKGELKFSNTKNICIFTDVVIHNDTLRIYNNHLESIHFQAKHYNFIDSLTHMNETERIEGLKDIYRRMKNAYIKRAEQAEKITEHISNSPYPVVVCGDFNDTHVSYTYKLLSNNLNDAFREKGFGFGATYNRQFFFLRIDYMLHSPKLSFRYFKTIKNKYSDHNPLVGIFRFQTKDHSIDNKDL